MVWLSATTCEMTPFLAKTEILVPHELAVSLVDRSMEIANVVGIFSKRSGEAVLQALLPSSHNGAQATSRPISVVQPPQPQRPVVGSYAAWHLEPR